MEHKLIEAIRVCLSSGMDAEAPSCGIYDTEDFEAYWDELLPPDAAEAMERHCLECRYCLKGIASAWQLFEKTEQICAGKDLNRFLGAARKKMDEIDEEQDSRLLWAAASGKEGLIGQALGVVVSVDEGRGALIECNAFVGEKSPAGGRFEILGRDVEGFDGYLVEKPLDYLEEKLPQGVFRGNVALKSYCLCQRDINVDLKERVIGHASSLSLAIVMAIINAFHRRSDPSCVYSADLRQDGRLQKVGQIDVKIETALRHGIRHVVMAGENEKDVSTKYLCRDDLELHFFDTLEEVFSFAGIEAEEGRSREEKSPVGEVPLPESDSAIGLSPASSRPARDALLDALCAEAGKREFWDRLILFFEGLCQSGELQDRLSTCFLVGAPDRIGELLPDAFMRFDMPVSLEAAADVIEDLAEMVDGRELCFIIDMEGNIDSIRRIAAQNCTPISLNVLPEKNQHMATISGMTASAVFYFPPFQNQIQVFSRGRLQGRYGSGCWHLTDYIRVASLLKGIAEKDAINWPVLSATVRAAVSLSDLGREGTFAFLPGHDVDNTAWEDGLSSEFSLHLEKPDLHQLDSSLLMSLAYMQGAVIINNEGHIVACNAILKSSRQRQNEKMKNLRHRAARDFSETENALVVVASRYDTITIYYGGEKIAET